MVLHPKSFREVKSLLTSIVTVTSNMLANTSVAGSIGVSEQKGVCLSETTLYSYCGYFFFFFF